MKKKKTLLLNFLYITVSLLFMSQADVHLQSAAGNSTSKWKVFGNGLHAKIASLSKLDVIQH